MRAEQLPAARRKGFPGDYTETVTRKKVAGMDVASLRGLLFWLLNRTSSSFCKSTGSTVLFCRFERIHGWPVVFSECSKRTLTVCRDS